MQAKPQKCYLLSWYSMKPKIKQLWQSWKRCSLNWAPYTIKLPGESFVFEPIDEIYLNHLYQTPLHSVPLGLLVQNLQNIWEPRGISQPFRIPSKKSLSPATIFSVNVGNFSLQLREDHKTSRVGLKEYLDPENMVGTLETQATRCRIHQTIQDNPTREMKAAKSRIEPKNIRASEYLAQGMRSYTVWKLWLVN